jgi:hypothetical protein
LRQRSTALPLMARSRGSSAASIAYEATRGASSAAAAVRSGDATTASARRSTLRTTRMP